MSKKDKLNKILKQAKSDEKTYELLIKQKKIDMKYWQGRNEEVKLLIETLEKGLSMINGKEV